METIRDNTSTIACVSAASTVSRMQINDTKAGMQNIDKEKINSIILKHSQSNFVVLIWNNFFLV